MFLKPSTLLGALFLLLVMLLSSIQAVHTGQPFEFIKQLEGCQKGQSVNGLSKLKQYLKRFGYLSNDDDRYTKQYPRNNNSQEYANDDEFDHILESAIKAYQLNYHLNVTGRLDGCTVNQMMKPRCGVADVVNGASSIPFSKKIHIGVSHYELFAGDLRWPRSKSHLKYKFKSSVQVPRGAEDVRSICWRAFQRWAAVTHFTFEEVAHTAAADIEIGFHRGDHGDGQPFDGPNGVVAHASAPTEGALHYDADEVWSSHRPGDDQMDLESVTVHEIGHLLGLDHSLFPDAVMYAYIDSGLMKRNLNIDDVIGIRTLYGLP